MDDETEVEMVDGHSQVIIQISNFLIAEITPIVHAATPNHHTAEGGRHEFHGSDVGEIQNLVAMMPSSE